MRRPSIVLGVALLQLGTGCGAHAKPAAVPFADGPARCAPAPQQQDMWQDLPDAASCRVAAFARVPGSSPPVFFQRQVFRVPGPDQADAGEGLALFTRSSGDRLVPLGGWSGTDAAIDPPRIERTPQGPILVLPMSAVVSSHPTYDAVFRVLGGRWTRVDQLWQAQISVPAGTAQRHGNAMDWPRLRAFGALWEPGDTECCPTGGSYIAQLRLDGRRLRLYRIRISRTDLPFP